MRIKSLFLCLLIVLNTGCVAGAQATKVSRKELATNNNKSIEITKTEDVRVIEFEMKRGIQYTCGLRAPEAFERKKEYLSCNGEIKSIAFSFDGKAAYVQFVITYADIDENPQIEFGFTEVLMKINNKWETALIENNYIYYNGLIEEINDIVEGQNGDENDLSKTL